MKKTVLATFGVATLLVAASAFAGWKRTDSIYIAPPGWSYAYGDSATVRGDGTTGTYIYCESFAYSTSGVQYGSCAAYNGTTYASCTTTNPLLVAVINSVGADGLIYFEWDSGSNCTFVETGHGSPWAPKQP